MSNLVTNRVQLGQSSTAANNFSLEVPTVPDGTIILGKGLAGAISTNVLSVGSTGNISIGTSSPVSGYRVAISGNGTTINGAIQLTNSGNTTTIGATSPSAADFEINNTANGFLRFSTNNTEQLRIDATGKVGIGTTSLVNKLEIGGSGDSIMRLLAAGQVNGLEIGQLTADGGNKIFAANNNYLAIGTNNTEKLRIGSSGQIGIGGANYGSAGQVLTSGGSGTAPSWSAVPLLNGTNTWSGISYFNNSTIINAQLGTGSIENPDYGTAGYVLTSNGPGSAPSWQNTGGSNGIASSDAKTFFFN